MGENGDEFPQYFITDYILVLNEKGGFNQEFYIHPGSSKNETEK